LLSCHHDDWDVHRTTTVQLELSGLEPGQTYAVRRTTIDANHANAHTAWQQMGCPQPPDAHQLSRLHAASRLVPASLGNAVAANGQAILTLTLETHSVSLLELAPVSV
jgi:beta-xylosidase